MIFYKIYHKTLENSKCYIGSTKQPIKNRFSVHICHYKMYMKGLLKNCCKSYLLFDEYGIENLKIEALITNDDLNKRETIERFLIENSLYCVNKNIPGRTVNEYYRDKGFKYHLQYYEKYKDKYKERHLTNKEKNNEYSRNYNEINKERLQEYRKQYYHKRKNEANAGV